MIVKNKNKKEKKNYGTDFKTFNGEPKHVDASN